MIDDSARSPTVYNVFMLVKTTPAFLAMPPEDRLAFLATDIAPILDAHPEVAMRFFDTEHFSPTTTDVIVWETNDLDRYRSVVERLRETPFWGTYFEINDILTGVENAYASYYEVPAIGTTR